MAMAAVMLVGVPSAGTVSTASSITRSKTRTGIEHRSRAICQHRCSTSDVPTGASKPGRDDGVACAASSSWFCSGRITRSPVMCSRNAHQLGWSASGLLRLEDVSGLALKRRRMASTRTSSALRIAAEKADLTNVAGTLYRLGKQGLEAGTKLVPESVPRPMAQAGVGLAAVVVASFLLRSLFSTLTFILAIGALSYAGYLFLNKGESDSSSGNGNSNGSPGESENHDDALEEARRIMEKYK